VQRFGLGDHFLRDVDPQVVASPSKVIKKGAVSAAQVVDLEIRFRADDARQLVEAQALRFGAVPVDALRGSAVSFAL
jgi:hypothetical protein